LGSFLVFGVGKASAATYYVRSDSPDNGGDGTTNAITGVNRAKQTLSAGVALLANGDTLNLRGTFSNQQLATPNRNNIIIQNESGYTATVDGSKTFAGHTLSIYGGTSGQTIRGITFQSPANGYNVGMLSGAGTVVEYCSFLNPSTVENVYVNSGTYTFRYNIVREQGHSGAYAALAFYNSASGNFYYNTIEVTSKDATGSAISHNSTNNAVTNITNNIIYGGEGTDGGTINVSNSTKTVNIYNNSIGSYRVKMNFNGRLIAGNASATTNVDYNILFPNMRQEISAGLTVSGALSSATDGGHNVIDSPKFTTSPYDGYLIVSFDDGAFDQIEPLMGVLANYGKHGTWFLNRRAAASLPLNGKIEADHNAAALRLYQQGHDIGSHARSHSNLSVLDAMKIQYTGGGGAAHLIISGNNLTITTPGGVHDFSYALGSGHTLLDLADALNATGYYNVPLSGTNINRTTITNTDSTTQYGYILCTSLADVDVANISTQITLLLNQSRYYADELDANTTWIESIVGSGNVQSFAAPYNGGNADTVSYTRGKFSQSRAMGYGTTNWITPKAEAIDLFNILNNSSGVFGLSGVKDLAMHRQYARMFAESLVMTNSVSAIFFHGYTDISVTEFDAVMSEWIEYPRLWIGSSKEFGDLVRNAGNGWVLSGDNVTYTKTPTYSPDFRLQQTSLAIDSGTDVSLTSDYEGNPIYGLPDIGGYEYQPVHDMAAATPDQPQIGEAIRVYGDGKFRNTIDDSEDNDTDTAKLSIVPQGSITTEWLDLNISAWNTSGDYHKTWTENSDTLGSDNTLHTIGDLVSGQAYSVKIDDVLATANITGADCTSGICTADENGEIIFTYTGGYSEHTFDIEDETAPVITITSPETGNTVSSDDTITFTDTEETDPECSTDNSNWINCTSTVTSFNDLIGWDDIEENDVFTLFMRDTDGAGNTGTTSTTNLTKADTQAPIRSDGSPEGELSSNTTETTIGLTTSEGSVCKYSTSSGTAYGSMTDVFANVDGTSHTATVSGLSSGTSYSYYARCQDESENANDTDYLISFSVVDVESNDEEEEEVRYLNTRKIKATSTQNSITITWKTDHNTRSTVRYGTNKNLKEKKKDNEKEKNHKLTLRDLLPDTKYYFKIKSEDGDDNEDKSKIHSIKTKAVFEKPVSNSNQNSEEKTVIPSYTQNITPNACSYTVQSGDTLWKIAQEVYGSGSAYPKIIEKNKDKYPNIASILSIGQELAFDCQNSGNVQGASDEKKDNKSENQLLQNQTQDSVKDSEARWWNPLSWF
jgi:LysM repeat protein